MGFDSIEHGRVPAADEVNERSQLRVSTALKHAAKSVLAQHLQFWLCAVLHRRRMLGAAAAVLRHWAEATQLRVWRCWQRQHELSSTRRKILGLVSREVVSRHLDAWGAHCDAKARARSLLDQAGRFQVLM